MSTGDDERPVPLRSWPRGYRALTTAEYRAVVLARARARHPAMSPADREDLRALLDATCGALDGDGELRSQYTAAAILAGLVRTANGHT